MKSKHNYFICGILLLAIMGVIFISGCVSDQPQASPPTQPSKTPQTTQQEAPQQTLTDSGNFQLFYDTVSSKDYLEYEKIFKNSGLFEEVIDELNNIVVLPYDVSVVFGECGTPNAFYDPTGKQITMCYELIDEIAIDFAEVAETEEDIDLAVIRTLLFIFYHELGHALIDIHDLPVTGREEDAVDQLSTIILIEAGKEGEEAVLDGALWFLLISEKTELDKSAFAGEHALDAQRFYNLACWIYGNDPQTHSYIVEDEHLPEERAVRCEDEYSRILKSWDTLLSPYIK